MTDILPGTPTLEPAKLLSLKPELGLSPTRQEEPPSPPRVAEPSKDIEEGKPQPRPELMAIEPIAKQGTLAIPNQTPLDPYHSQLIPSASAGIISKPRKIPICKHSDRTVYARGLCGPCYQR